CSTNRQAGPERRTGRLVNKRHSIGSPPPGADSWRTNTTSTVITGGGAPTPLDPFPPLIQIRARTPKGGFPPPARPRRGRPAGTAQGLGPAPARVPSPGASGPGRPNHHFGYMSLQVFDKLMVRRPEDRFQTAAEAAESDALSLPRLRSLQPA